MTMPRPLLRIAILLPAAALWFAPLIGSQSPEIPLGLDLYLPVPDDNPMTPAVVDLGRRLFADPILSIDESIACASCHDPGRGFASSAAVAVGVFGRRGGRNAPTLVNRAYGRFFFWDGRTTTLEEQVVRPIEDPNEMGLPLDAAVARLRRHPEYPARFRRTFGRAVNADDVARALAGYLRSILAGDTPFDRYAAGDRDALEEEAVRGLRLFRGRAGCSNCHHGTNFTDESFHNTGVAWRNGELLDVGRFAVSGVATDRGAFKTPTLRQVALTGPYMHDGSIDTLAEVVDFYSRGGNPNPWLDPEIVRLDLSEAEKAALRKFLESLSSERRD
jgi:cytochrome c peroxidase